MKLSFGRVVFIFFCNFPLRFASSQLQFFWTLAVYITPGILLVYGACVKSWRRAYRIISVVLGVPTAVLGLVFGVLSSINPGNVTDTLKIGPHDVEKIHYWVWGQSGYEQMCQVWHILLGVDLTHQIASSNYPLEWEVVDSHDIAYSNKQYTYSTTERGHLF